MTTNQILTASDSDLLRLLGEVLQPEKNKHHREPLGVSRLHAYKCRKCHETFADFDAVYTGICTFADPISLTWPEAMKWRDWAVEKYGIDAYFEAFTEVTTSDNLLNIVEVPCYAQPKHYLQACALCVLEEKK